MAKKNLMRTQILKEERILSINPFKSFFRKATLKRAYNFKAMCNLIT